MHVCACVCYMYACVCIYIHIHTCYAGIQQTPQLTVTVAFPVVLLVDELLEALACRRCLEFAEGVDAVDAVDAVDVTSDSRGFPAPSTALCGFSLVADRRSEYSTVSFTTCAI
jgi:hypothetical protein